MNDETYRNVMRAIAELEKKFAVSFQIVVTESTTSQQPPPHHRSTTDALALR